MANQDRNLDRDETLQRALDPHRVEEQHKARQESEARLDGRGIEIRPEDADGDVADLQDTVERFEAEVQRQGGDLMVNHIGSSRPEDPAFVPPVRQPEEKIAMYLRRLEDAMAVLVERRTRIENAQ